MHRCDYYQKKIYFIFSINSGYFDKKKMRVSTQEQIDNENQVFKHMAIQLANQI